MGSVSGTALPFFNYEFSGLASSFITSGIAVLIALLAGVTPEGIQDNTLIIAAPQVLSAIINISAARLIYTRNWGFDFVPSERRSRVKIQGTNAVLIAIISVLIVVSVIISLLFQNNFDKYVINACLIFLITLPVFLYFSLRKDFEDAA